MEVEPGDTSVLVRLLIVVTMSVAVVFLTPLVVTVEVDTIDSVVLMGVAIVTDVDCDSVGEDIIVVDDNWLLGGS